MFSFRNSNLSVCLEVSESADRLVLGSHRYFVAAKQGVSSMVPESSTIPVDHLSVVVVEYFLFIFFILSDLVFSCGSSQH